jgi:HAD superfamily hydrolase (TIGR01509 family)
LIELVIFDCDGVLVDTERLAVKVDVEVLGELGWHLSEQEVIERFVGRPETYFRAAVEEWLGRPLPRNWEEITTPRYRKTFRENLLPVEGIHEALEYINVPTCVASSGSHEKMRFTLGITKLYAKFEGRIFSTSEVAHGKPAPDIFLHAAKQMGVQPARCVVIEDSVSGVRAAVAANMKVLGFSGSVTSASSLASSGARVFNAMNELPRLIQEIA